MVSLRRTNSFIIFLIVILSGAAFYFTSMKFSTATLEKSLCTDMKALAKSVSSKIQEYNEKQFTLLRNLAVMDYFRDGSRSIEAKQKMLDPVTDSNDFMIGINITDKKGTAYITTRNVYANFSDRLYFKEAISGKEYIMPPMVNKVSNDLSMFYIVPVYDYNNKVNNTILTCAYGDILSKVCKDTIVSPNSRIMIVDRSTGLLIGDIDEENVRNFVPAVNIDKHFASALDNSENVKLWGKNKNRYVTATCPVEGTTWTVLINSPFTDFSHDLIMMGGSLKIFIMIYLILAIIATLGINRAFIPLQRVGKAIEEISTGKADLTKRLSTRAKFSEITVLVDGFNKFQEKLQTIVASIKNSEKELAGISENLSSNTLDIHATAQLLENLKRFTAHIDNQLFSVDETVSNVNTLAKNINLMDELVTHQGESVEQSINAVGQMIQNIEEVNSSVESMVNSFEVLEKNAVAGEENQHIADLIIKQIEEQSKTLQDANTTISNIANQTNLLAMNAAIEAAHAGEAGKGFSVVADEIRKLSESSSNQSKQIETELQKISDSITNVVQASLKSSRSFAQVKECINSTNQIVTEIQMSMNRQSEGGHKINEFIEELNKSSKKVLENSKQMIKENSDMENSVCVLEYATGKMKQSMEKMSADANKIDTSGNVLSELSEKIRSLVNQIGEEIDSFEV